MFTFQSVGAWQQYHYHSWGLVAIDCLLFKNCIQVLYASIELVVLAVVRFGGCSEPRLMRFTTYVLS